jgi:PhnB protein
MIVNAGLPPGIHSVTPRMVVGDVAAAAGFLRAVFGATGEVRDDRPAEIRIGDSVIIVSAAGAGAVPGVLVRVCR